VRILLTNDDGVSSDGLWAAARGLARVGDLTVIGTMDDWSGGSASIRFNSGWGGGARLLPYADVPADLPSNVKAYAIDAAPGGAILAGLMCKDLFDPFDLVASGANYGNNIGSDLSHSGTLGAAVTAYQRGLTAFAISTGRGRGTGDPQHWDGVSDVAERVARWLGAWGGASLLLNVNVPNLPLAEMRAATIVPPIPWGHLDRAGFVAEAQPEGGWRLVTQFAPPRPDPNDPSTDYGAVLAGLIAVTPVTPIGGPPPYAPPELAQLLEALVPGSASPTGTTPAGITPAGTAG
jgi:5'-nucleotidase